MPLEKVSQFGFTVLSVFFQVLLGFTGFYRVLPGFIEFYRVSMLLETVTSKKKKR